MAYFLLSVTDLALVESLDASYHIVAITETIKLHHIDPNSPGMGWTTIPDSNRDPEWQVRSNFYPIKSVRCHVLKSYTGRDFLSLGEEQELYLLEAMTGGIIKLSSLDTTSWVYDPLTSVEQGPTLYNLISFESIPASLLQGCQG